MQSLVDKLIHVHRLLDAQRLSHAFGGALALAWCTREPRGTSDLDVNVFVEVSDTERVLAALATVTPAEDGDVDQLRTHGQARLWWETTPIDLFLNNTPFHNAVALRVRYHELAGVRLPFLSCDDLAIFKAFFNRGKDWVDIETMIEAGALRQESVADTLASLLGSDDDRVTKLRALKHEA